MAFRTGLLGACIGFAVAKALPDLLPEAGATFRPLAKELIKGGFTLADSLQQLVAEGREHFSDLVAEVEYERSVLASAKAEPHPSALNGTSSNPHASGPRESSLADG
jgi:hypothetical protein